MASKIFRDRLINSIKNAIHESNSISQIDHSGLIGRYREILSSKMLEPMLPEGYKIGSGKICDRFGNLSDETDLIIYNASILPPVLYSERDGIYPMEACYYSLEIKSKLTAAEVKDAYRKGVKLVKLLMKNTNQDYSSNSAFNLPVLLTLFAFDSDLNGDKKTELERYAEIDPDWLQKPIYRAICVIGKGYWYYCSEPKQWVFLSSSENFDEVVDLVGGISNTVSKANLAPRIGSIGQYISIERPFKII